MANLPTNAGDADLSGSTNSIFDRIRGGDQASLNQLLDTVYDELRRVAGSQMAKQARDHTLQPTALVNEAYMRLQRRDGDFKSHAHFMAMAAKVMRQILVDHSRRKSAGNRPPKSKRVEAEVLLEEATREIENDCFDLAELDGALRAIEAEDPQCARLVELYVFAGQPMEETARQLGVSLRTAYRMWADTKDWLQREIVSND